MNETVLGALVGGLVVSIVPVVSLGLEFKKWKKERLVTHLKAERERLSKMFEEIRKDIKLGIDNNQYSYDTVVDVLRRCPKRVSGAFQDLINEKENTRVVSQFHYVKIVDAMSGVLAELDAKIESAYS